MATTYNPYQDIQKVYNAKTAWNTATTDEERKRQNEIATAARKNLEAYGYSDVANQISASGADATAARKILEQYAPKTKAPDSTTLSNSELITTNNNETRNKINQLWGTQTGDRQVMADKYDKLENTAYSNPFESEEGKAIIGKYDLAALQGRDNVVASGGASNSGNIDSYAAANALRQQAALTAKGQAMALDAHNNKINNVKGILESLGVYQQNQDAGMQNTISLQSNEGQRLFENDETAKNNEVARLEVQANVTGYTPNEWVIKNDDVYKEFLNEDGTFKTEKENVDIQARINQTTDPETKKKLAVVRAKKALGNYGVYGKYLKEGDVAFMDGGVKTEAADQFDKTMTYNYDVLKTEEDMNNANNQNAIDQIVTSAKYGSSSKSGSTYTGKLTAAQARDAIKSGIITEDTIAAFNHHYGTDYTVENPPVIGKETEPGAPPANPLTNEQVEEWANYFNGIRTEQYGEGFEILQPTGDGKYKPTMDADYLILEIFGSDNLTEEQKEYLIKKFGITDEQVKLAIKEKDRYNR